MGSSVDATDRRDESKRAGHAVVDHVAGGGPADEQMLGEVDPQVCLPGGEVDRHEVRPRRETDDVGDGAEPAERLARLIDDPLGTCRIGDVTGDRHTADLFGHLGRPVAVKVGDGHPRTDRGEQVCRSPADSRTASDNESRFPVQPERITHDV